MDCILKSLVSLSFTSVFSNGGQRENRCWRANRTGQWGATFIKKNTPSVSLPLSQWAKSREGSLIFHCSVSVATFVGHVLNNSGNWRTSVSAKMSFSCGLSLLLIHAGLLNAFWWNIQVTTKGPKLDKDSSDGAMTLEDQNIADVGSDIDVARGIQGSVQNWDQNPTVNWKTAVTMKTPGTSLKLDHSKTGNDKSLSEEVKHELDVKDSSGDTTGSGLGSGPTLDLTQESKTTATNLTGTWVIDNRISIISTPAFPKDSTNCIPRGSDWPFCLSLSEVTFSVPNFFNHTQAEDVVAVLNEWGWLLRSGCHHGLEWFFCLLLAPRCHQTSEKPGVALLPCRTFCEVLLDSCWTVLQERGLPVACHTLPEGPEPSQSCVIVSNPKGKTLMHFKLVALVLSVCVI